MQTQTTYEPPQHTEGTWMRDVLLKDRLDTSQRYVPYVALCKLKLSPKLVISALSRLIKIGSIVSF